MIIAGRLSFFGDHAHLANSPMLRSLFGATAQAEWVVYAKRPFGGPEAMLAYLSRYAHRVAIANSRLIAFDQQGVRRGSKTAYQKSHGNLVMLPPSNVQRTADRGRIVAKRAISPDLITCL
jgi:hypothetical protein